MDDALSADNGVRSHDHCENQTVGVLGLVQVSLE